MSEPLTILCYGDSNTYGYNPANGLRYPKSVRWTGRLQEMLGEACTVIEEGCNGRTTVFVDPVEEWKCGLDYLKPCLNTHKPVSLVILMLGSNDLKTVYNASAREIAAGAERLVRIIQSFTKEKQGFEAEILLIAPPVIGDGIMHSPFSMSFDETAVERSGQFAEEYRRVAKNHHCLFLNAAEYIQSSAADSLHLDPDAHAALAEAIFYRIQSSSEIIRLQIRRQS